TTQRQRTAATCFQAITAVTVDRRAVRNAASGTSSDHETLPLQPEWHNAGRDRETMGRYMLIGEAAARVGTSPRSLRHYEQQGLLSPSREHNGYRVYGQTDVIRAGNIKALLDLGLTTADVHGYVAAGCLDEHLTDERSCPEE